MSITLNNSDFQCLQDQLVDLKTKNYELAEKNRRSQADFEAAKAKICILQLKIEEQERDFQVTSTTLRREIEAVNLTAGGGNNNDTENNKENKSHDEDYKAKYKKLLHKAKELQLRYEKSVEVVQQYDAQNKNLAERLRRLDEDNLRLREELEAKQKQLDVIEKENEEKLTSAIEEFKSQNGDEKEKRDIDFDAITSERDTLREEVKRLTAEVNNFDNRLESQAEERKIHERKGLQIVKELKRQLAIEKNRSETLQKRLENLLKQPPSASAETDLENRSTRLSTSSSTNGNSSSNGNGSRANQDANSVGSWSFVPTKTNKSSNHALNETISLCSIDSESRETVQQPCDSVSEDSMQLVATTKTCDNNVSPGQNISVTASNTLSSSSSQKQKTSSSLGSRNEGLIKQNNFSSPSYSSSHSTTGDGMLIEEQAALVDRLTRMQHEKWTLEEKLSYLEQANLSLSEDLANKSDIIKHYFMDQALKASNIQGAHGDSSTSSAFGGFNSNGNNMSGYNNSRKTSFPNNVNHLLMEKPSLKKVVDFLKERSQVSSIESDNISREATKKMQLMLEETLIKCLKLQENLDFVSSELNKLKS